MCVMVARVIRPPVIAPYTECAGPVARLLRSMDFFHVGFFNWGSTLEPKRSMLLITLSWGIQGIDI